MNPWSLYETRVNSRGQSKRDESFNRELYMLNKKLKDSLSYHSVKINGLTYEIAITNSDNLNEKTIYSVTQGVITGGELIDWMDNHWLVVECDANSEIYTKAQLRRCNYLLKWVDEENCIHEQWCIIEDGTKLRKLVSVQRNLYVKISIELLETPKAIHTTT